MSVPRGNHYEVLQLQPGATTEQIEKAYRLGLALSHAEPGGSDEEGQRIARERIDHAFEVLHDPERREQYDRLHGFPPPPPPGAVGVPRPVFSGMREPRRKSTRLVANAPVPESLAAMPPPDGPPVPVGTGAELRKVREERGVRLEDIASVTKLSRRTLEDIENERWDRLPAAVYLKSFLRQYARLIGVDPAGTVEAYMKRAPRRG